MSLTGCWNQVSNKAKLLKNSYKQYPNLRLYWEAVSHMKTEASKYKIHPSARVGGWLNLGGEECAWPPLNTS